MRGMTPANLADVTGGRLICPPELCEKEITAVTTDSRLIEAGGLFVPIKGTRVDGHDFIPQVMEKGALLTLTEREEAAAGHPCLVVDSAEDAMRSIAAFYFDEMAVPTVAITGSVGKTSTKETIAAVLSQKFRVLKTAENFNNEYGVPQTVFNLRDDHEMAVIELGISHFGDMKVLGNIVKPDIAVITNIGTCHLEFLEDRDGVFREKTDMLNYLREGGRAVLNGDDDKLIAVKETRGAKPLFFGLGEHNDYRAEDIRPLGFKGTACRIITPESTFEAVISIPGEHMVYNALAACAVGRLAGLTDEEIAAGLKSIETLSGRFSVIETGRLTVIDDCYNANPMSVKAALKLLAASTDKDMKGRRIAVLGDMAELGKDEADLHREVGAFMRDYKPDVLMAGGPLAKYIFEGAKDIVRDAFWYPDAEALKAGVREVIEDGDTVLVKASHCMHFEGIVKELTSI